MIKEKVFSWPTWLLDAQKGIKSKKIKTAVIKKVSRGQTYLWRALNIYDDFLDGDGQAAKLSSANTYFRRYLEIHYRLNLAPSFYRLFDKIQTDAEKANQEEASQARLKIIQGKIFPPRTWPEFKNLTDLSRKSLPLALGPLALNRLSEIRPDRKRELAILNFFRYALAAKQLSDDARDWWEDLQNGAISAVNILILKKGLRRKISLDLEKRPETIHLLFVTAASVPTSQRIKRLCQKARQEGSRAGWPPTCTILKEIIGPLEAAVQESERFRSLLK